MSNENTTVWIFQRIEADGADPGSESVLRQNIYKSIRQGVSRFGCSYEDSFDLRCTGDNWDLFNDKHKKDINDCKQLLDIKVGDWIIHKHIPYENNYIAVRVVYPYFFNKEGGFPNQWGDVKDFRHCIVIDSTFEFTKDTIRGNRLDRVIGSPRRLFSISNYNLEAKKQFFELKDSRV